jgi:outer membrane protein assembly factor BamB
MRWVGSATIVAMMGCLGLGEFCGGSQGLLAAGISAVGAATASQLTADSAASEAIQESSAAAQDTPEASAKAEPWNQWRGAQRDTIFRGPQWPTKLGAGNLKSVWQVPLEPSYSGPITDGQRLFTTETVKKKEETVRAYDLATGKSLWEVRWAGAMTVPFFAAANGSWIRSTPACDAERLYVVGMLDVLVCLESATGKELWQIDFAKQYETGKPPFGAVCSPLLDADHVYVQAANSFFKIRKQDGQVVWRTMIEDGGMMSGGSFSSPSFATLGDRRQILVQSRLNLAGIDPESGEVLWQTEVPNFRGMNILTPIEFENSVFTSSYNHQSYLYQVPARFGGTAASENVSLAWSNPAKGYMSTPAIIDQHAYLLLQNGRLACLSLKDGERKWTGPKKFGDYASFVSQGDRILMLSNDGVLRLIQATTEDCVVISEYQIPGVDDSWAHVGMGVGGQGQIQIYVRAINGLHVFDWLSE